MWSRDGNFDGRSGQWLEPNHFISLLKSEKVKNKTKQSTKALGVKITDFFHGKGGPQKHKSSKLPDLELPQRNQRPDYTISMKTRKLLAGTVEKWKSNDLATYNANVWLTYQEEIIGGKNYCKCKVCSEFITSINKHRNFNRTFIDGNTNQ